MQRTIGDGHGVVDANEVVKEAGVDVTFPRLGQRAGRRVQTINVPETQLVQLQYTPATAYTVWIWSLYL